MMWRAHLSLRCAGAMLAAVAWAPRWGGAETQLVVWGQYYSDHTATTMPMTIPEATKAQLEAAPGISLLAAGSFAFAAVTTEGRVYAWGDPEYGGSIPEETKAALDAASGISRLVGGQYVFTIWTMEGECLVWGRDADSHHVHDNACSITERDYADANRYSTGTGSSGAFVITASSSRTPETWHAHGLSGDTSDLSADQLVALQQARGIPLLAQTVSLTPAHLSAYAAVLCAPGQHVFSHFDRMHGFGCEDCPAGSSSGPPTASNVSSCVGCAPGKSSVAKSPGCCDDTLYPLGCSFYGMTRANGTSLCPVGTGLDTATAAYNAAAPTKNLSITMLACKSCPHRSRCIGDGGCVKGSTGNMCGKCEDGYYALGPKCALCSKDKLQPALVAGSAFVAILAIFWKFTQIVGATTTMNCVLSFGSADGGYNIAVDLKNTIVAMFDWPRETVYIDGDAMEHKPETVREERTDGAGNTYFVSLNPYWHVYFREAISETPAILFSLTKAWCESPYCKQELVWHLVSKMMGPEQLLRAQHDAQGVTHELYASGVIQRVQSMSIRDRVILWDGAYFLASSEVLGSSTVQLLRELNCPETNICHYEDKETLLREMQRYVITVRNTPEMQRRRSNFVRGYAAAPLVRHMQSSYDVVAAQRGGISVDAAALKVDLLGLKHTLAVEAAHAATQVYALVAQIVWPHFSFSILLLLLPHIKQPAFVTDLANFLESLSFLDAGQLARPECFFAATSAAHKNLVRFCTTHGAFWLVLAMFGAYGLCKGCCSKNDPKAGAQTALDHAVNASVWAFTLFHAILLRSCLGTLHCIRIENDDDSCEFANDGVCQLVEEPGWRDAVEALKCGNTCIGFEGHKHRAADHQHDATCGQYSSLHDCYSDDKHNNTCDWIGSLSGVECCAGYGDSGTSWGYQIDCDARCLPHTDATDCGTTLADTSWLGHLQSDPATSCDARTTYLMLLLAVTLALLAVREYLLRPEATDLNASPGSNPRLCKCVIKMGGLCCCCCCCCLCSICCILLCFYILRSPVEQLGADEYVLPVLGTFGLCIYGLTIPRFLYTKLRVAADANVLNAPVCRNRYGFLFTRYKEGCWGAEFRILARKSVLLFVNTIFAEQWYCVIPAQLCALTWALWRQCVETPFAEVGFARRQFVDDHPDGVGWSRGDNLEAVSLLAQIVNTLTSLVCVGAAGGFGFDIVISLVTLICLVVPACGGLQMVLDQAWMGKKDKMFSPRWLLWIEANLASSRNAVVQCCYGKTVTSDTTSSVATADAGLRSGLLANQTVGGANHGSDLSELELELVTMVRKQ